MKNQEVNFAGYMQIVEETIRDTCRTCKHSRYDHATCPRKGKKPCLHDDLNLTIFDCKCKNFETLDNLVYLEEKYNERLGQKSGSKSNKSRKVK